MYWIVVHKHHGIKLRYGGQRAVMASETANANGVPPVMLIRCPAGKVAEMRQELALGATLSRVMQSVGAH